MLHFDEADSFLRDRGRAMHSWETAAVNEFLSQLEAHRAICACTTNLMADLDAAAMRRFLFKVEFKPPRPDQAALVLGRLLAGVVSPMPEALVLVEMLRPLAGLTAGHIAVVARRLRVLRMVVPPERAVAELRGEVAVKGQAVRAVGFSRRDGQALAAPGASALAGVPRP